MHWWLSSMHIICRICKSLHLELLLCEILSLSLILPGLKGCGEYIQFIEICLKIRPTLICRWHAPDAIRHILLVMKERLKSLA